MARRRSENNMFLNSQETANISANEKDPAPSVPAHENSPAKAKTQQKTAKTVAAPVKKQKPVPQSTDAISVPGSVQDVLNILAATKETRQNGIAKSIYLDKDIHDKVLSLSQQSGIPFSKIINMLLKAAFRDSEA